MTYYNNPDLKPLEAQLAYEQRQKRRATAKAAKAKRSILSATSAEFHPMTADYNVYFPPVRIGSNVAFLQITSKLPVMWLLQDYSYYCRCQKLFR